MLRKTAYLDAGVNLFAISSYSAPYYTSGINCTNLSRELLGRYLVSPLTVRDADTYYDVVQKVLGELEEKQKHSPCSYINDVLQYTKVHDRFDKTPQSRMEFLLLVLSIVSVESSGSITAAGRSGNGLMQIILKYVGSSLYLIARNNDGQLPPAIVEFFKSNEIEVPSYAQLQDVRRSTLNKNLSEIDKFVKDFKVRKLLTNASTNIILGTHFLGFLLSKKQGGKFVSVRSAIYSYNGSEKASAYLKKVMAVFYNLIKLTKPLPEGRITFAAPMFLRQSVA